jgi:cytochrome b561
MFFFGVTPAAIGVSCCANDLAAREQWKSSKARSTNMPEVSRYHPALVALHWLLAFLIIAALALGALVMARLPNSDPMKLEALRSHMAGGVLILALMLVRLVVRTRTAHPPPATTGSSLLDKVAWVSHRLFYGLIIAMVASGATMALQAGLFGIVYGGHGALPPDLWVYPIRSVHYLVSRVLMALIALHVAGALYHTIILKDGLLRRMAFGRRMRTSRQPITPAVQQPFAKVRS